MARKPKPKPSFFKILIGDSTRQLTLPPYFVRKHREALPATVKLRTSSGETWDVKIEQTDDGKNCFTEGWSKFLKDLGLEIGDFLLLRFDFKKSTFDVSVFGANGCEKKVTGPVKSEPDDDVGLNEGIKFVVHESGSEAADTRIRVKCENSRPRFEIVLKQYQRSRMLLRRDFVEKARLIGEKAIVLEYEQKPRRWAVLLDRKRLKDGSYRLELATGWHKFRKANGLEIGKSYSFVFDPVKNVIQVEPVHKK